MLSIVVLTFSLFMSAFPKSEPGPATCSGGHLDRRVQCGGNVHTFLHVLHLTRRLQRPLRRFWPRLLLHLPCRHRRPAGAGEPGSDFRLRDTLPGSG